RAREVEVMLGHADRDRGRHQRAHLLADAAADHLGGQRVGPDQPGRPMLLRRADRDDDAGPGLEILFDELPSLELKLHGTNSSNFPGTWDASCSMTSIPPP